MQSDDTLVWTVPVLLVEAEIVSPAARFEVYTAAAATLSTGTYTMHMSIPACYFCAFDSIAPYFHQWGMGVMFIAHGGHKRIAHAWQYHLPC
jgi:hypothetical protein